MDWSVAATRRLLRELTRTGRLERDPAGIELRDALGSATVRDAMLDVIERALRSEPAACRDIVERCDVRGDSTAEAAAALGLSLRSFFRYRGRANDAIAAFIARLIANGAHRAVTPAAQLTLIGYFHLARRTAPDCAAAIDAFTAAIHADPRDARGYAGLACAYVESIVDLCRPPSDTLRLAENTARRALQLAPRSAAAHGAFAIVALRRNSDLSLARNHIAEAMTLDPRDPLAVAALWLLALSERDLDAAQNTATTLIALEPSSISQRLKRVLITSLQGDYAGAIQQCRVVLSGEAAPLARLHLMDAFNALGRPSDAIALADLNATPYELASLADAHARLGQRTQALACAQRLDAMHSNPYTRAIARAAAEDTSAAIGMLEIAFAEDPVWRNIAPYDPGLASLRRLPRFRKLVNAR